MALLLRDLLVPFGADGAAVRAALAARLGIDANLVVRIAIRKRSIDLRKRGSPRHVLTIAFATELPEATLLASAAAKKLRLESIDAVDPPPAHWPIAKSLRADRAPTVIIGMGPAGFFVALRLAQAGLPAIVLERGKPAEERGRDVARLFHHGIVEPESNLCYGEGGAGTFSDGKIHTRTRDPRIASVVEAFIEAGGDPALRVEGKPHIGTNLLVKLLPRLRKRLVGFGHDVRFGARVVSLEVAHGRVEAVVLASGERIAARRVVFATGHSARDSYRMVLEAGARITPKAFAVGVRVEHPQELIDRIQLGGARPASFPPAEYAITCNAAIDGSPRGIYSFCMCPGGQVVPCATHDDESVVNGMSLAMRSEPYANSALVVTVSPADFHLAPPSIEDHGASTGPLAGLDFQTRMERAAGALSGGHGKAPAQRLTDFLARRDSASLQRSNFRPGLVAAPLDRCLPAMIAEGLRAALPQFDRAMRGFITSEANLIGVESRTSAPLRIERDGSLQSPTLRGLYPCGEGAGHSGGIMSSAVDGIHVAEAIIAEEGLE